MVTYLFIGLSAAAAIGFMLAIAAKWKPKRLLFLKTLASLLFLGVGISAYFYSEHASVAQYILLILGLCFGVIGDSLLACKEFNKSKEDLFILLGTIAFSLGHIFFISLFCTLNQMSFVEPLVAIGLAAWVVLFTKMMKFNYRKLLIPATVYSFVIFLMLICAVVTMFAVNFTPAAIALCVGSFLFVISDMVLAAIYFGPKKIKGLGAVNLSCYYSAQILIAFSLMLL